MKKKLAVLLCSVICLGAFTGCSGDEIAFLKVSNDVAAILENGKITGTVQAEINFDEMYEHATKLGESYYAEGYEVEESEDLQGKKTFVVDYVLHTNAKEAGYDLSVDVKYNGKTYDMGTVSHTAKNGTFITGETLVNMYQLIDDIDTGEAAHFKLSEEYAKEYKKIVEEKKYIKLTEEEELSVVSVEEVLSEQDIDELYDAATKLLINTLEGYETGLVKAVPDGIEFSGTGLMLGKSLANSMYFFAENPTRLLDETEKFINTVLDGVEKDAQKAAAAKEELKELFAAAKTESGEYAEIAKMIGEMIEEAINEEHTKILLEELHFKETIVKSGEGYEANGLYQMKNGENDVFKITKKEKYEKANTGIAVPKSFVKEEELQKELVVLDDKYNPITGVELDWGFDEEGTEALLYTVRKMPAYAEEPLEWTTVFTEEGTTYVPLRLIAEKLGETIGWERETKTAYIMKDGQRVDMKGKLVEKTMYVGILDFEKLGYTVESKTSEDGIKEAKIMK